MSSGIKGYFYPELCEKLFDEHRMCTGRLPLENAQVISGEPQFRGGFGDAYQVNWFKPGVELAVFPHDTNDATCESTKRCCLKEIKRIKVWNREKNKYLPETDAEYAKRVYEEYDLLRKACGAFGRVPRPLALGTVRMRSEGHEEEVSWAICMEFLPTQDGTRYFLSDEKGIHDGMKDLGDRFHGFAAGECRSIELARLAYHMCLALIDLHKKGVTHRDLQPRNVAVSFAATKDGGKGVERVFFIDLGNSALAKDDVTPSTGGANHLAHPSFGAPEMFAFEDVYDVNSKSWQRKKYDYYDRRKDPTVDIWSFGAIIYFYHFNSYPDVLNEFGSVFKKWAVKKQNGIRLLKHGSSAANCTQDSVFVILDEIVHGCTKYNPADRTTLEDIKRKLEGLPGIRATMRDAYFDVDVLPESPTKPVQIGDWVLNILHSYARVPSNRFFHEYERQTHEITYSLMVSCDYNVQIGERDAYISELFEQIRKLYGEGAIVANEEIHSVATSNTPLEKLIHSFELLEKTDDNTAFLSKHYICFVDDMAIRVGIACRDSCEEKLMPEINASMNRELAEAVRSLRRV